MISQKSELKTLKTETESTPQRPIINIGVAFDLNYLSPFTVLLTSILCNNRTSTIHVHAIVSGVDEKHRNKLRKFITKSGGNIFFYEVSDHRVAAFNIPQDRQWSKSVYHRLYLPELLPCGVDRILYLDTDIVVVNDLSTLYQTDLRGLAAGAVAEVTATTIREDIGITEPGTYFNSGVMLIDIKTWRAQSVSEKTIDVLLTFPGQLRWADQDALNIVLAGKYLKLEGKNNAIHSDVPANKTRAQYRQFVKEQVVIHYTLKRNKPWSKISSSKLRFVYMEYLSASPCWSEGFLINLKYNLVMHHRAIMKAIRKLHSVPDLNSHPQVSGYHTRGNQLLPASIHSFKIKNR